jgi:RNA polymerase sigma-70 factor (ECF subfamily)
VNDTPKRSSGSAGKAPLSSAVERSDSGLRTLEPGRDAGASLPNPVLTPAEETEFEKLYRDYRSRVFGTAYRMVSNHADAEDVTQDVFVKVFKKLDSFRGESALSTWIYRITMNTCLDFLRRRKLRQTVPLEDETEYGSQPMSIAKLVEGTLPRMPEGYRQVFVLYDIQGLKHSEIAAALGITEGASKSQLHRARAFLRRRLAPHVESLRWLREV